MDARRKLTARRKPSTNLGMGEWPNSVGVSLRGHPIAFRPTLEIPLWAMGCPRRDTPTELDHLERWIRSRVGRTFRNLLGRFEKGRLVAPFQCQYSIAEMSVLNTQQLNFGIQSSGFDLQ